MRMRDGAGLALLVETIGETITRARVIGAEASELAEALDAAVNRLAETTRTVWSQPDADLALANATTYMEAAGHVVVAWIWLEQFLVADGQQGDRRRQARSGAIFLPLRTAHDRTAIRSRQRARPDRPGPGSGPTAAVEALLPALSSRNRLVLNLRHKVRQRDVWRSKS